MLKMKKIAMVGLAGIMGASLASGALVASAGTSAQTDATNADVIKPIEERLGFSSSTDDHGRRHPSLLRRIVALWSSIPHSERFDRFLYSEYNFLDAEGLEQVLAATPGKVTQVSVADGMLTMMPNDPDQPIDWTFNPEELHPSVVRILERMEKALSGGNGVAAETDGADGTDGTDGADGADDPASDAPEVVHIEFIKSIIVSLSGDIKLVLPVKGFYRHHGRGDDGDGVPRPLLKRFRNADDDVEGLRGKIRAFSNEGRGRGPVNSNVFDRLEGLPEELHDEIAELREQLANHGDLSKDAIAKLRSELAELLADARGALADADARDRVHDARERLTERLEALRERRGDHGPEAVEPSPATEVDDTGDSADDGSDAGTDATDNGTDAGDDSTDAGDQNTDA